MDCQDIHCLRFDPAALDPKIISPQLHDLESPSSLLTVTVCYVLLLTEREATDLLNPAFTFSGSDKQLLVAPSMAPIQPSHRTSLPTKSILKSTSSTSTSSPSAASISKSASKPPSSSLFPANKSDKRRIKHSALLSKISKSHPSSQKTKQRRRRPNKKLVTTLSSLADALPESDDGNASPVANGSSTSTDLRARNDTAGYTPQAQVNVIKRKSVKSKPGALKRKQNMDNEERRRWGRNVAQLSGGANAVGVNASPGAAGGEEGARGVSSDSTRKRWAALRGFIGQTLERRDDVKVVGS